MKAANMSEDIAPKVINYLESHNPGNIKGLSLAPNVAKETLLAARNKYAAQLSSAEKPLILFEKKTIVGMLKTAFILTDQNFYYYGWNDPSKMGGDPRSGAFPLKDIRSIVFKKGSFELNGFTFDTSDGIPVFFEIGKDVANLLNDLFFELLPCIQNLGSGIAQSSSGPSGSGPVPTGSQVSATQSPPMAPQSNPLTAGPRQKPGCFKVGCAVAILIGAVILLIMGLQI